MGGKWIPAMVDMELVGYEIFIFIFFKPFDRLDVWSDATFDVELFGFICIDLYSGVLVFKWWRYGWVFDFLEQFIWIVSCQKLKMKSEGDRAV